ncbi:hypothetical protein [Streptomyces sp. NPDC051567]
MSDTPCDIPRTTPPSPARTDTPLTDTPLIAAPLISTPVPGEGR